ncbi:MAG: glucosamine-6-phosphate synthase, partial [Planctomycetota bacterium]
MCGIIAVLRRREQSDPVSPSVIDEWLDAACRAVAPGEQNWNGALERLAEAATFLQRMNESLLGSAGLRCMIEHPGLTERLEVSLTELEQRIVSLESALDAGEKALSALTVESINSAIIRVKDALWAVRNDRVRNSRAVADLAGPDPGPAALDGYASIQTALSALDRLEVRGRDSAGLHVLVSGHGLELESPKIRAMLEPGLSNRLFTSGAVRTPAGQLGFVYKAAAEIGELGDNGAELRRAIRGDALLRLALGGENASAAVLGHTRWASVGFVSQANAHPLNQEELDQEPGSEAMPFVTAVLNGDVDNHADLEAHEALRIPPEITTDAKVIPVLVSRRLAAGRSLEDAFRQTVASFEGSVAIAAQAALDPERLLLALHGSGQALYVGLGRESFIVASEPYGVIEECSTYLRMDGERPGNPDHPSASRGQIIVLDRGQAGRVGGIRRMAYDGTELPVEARDLTGADITTRDI